MILAIDPGTTQSAFVAYENGDIIDKGILDNEELLEFLENKKAPVNDCSKLYIEMVASYGMAVGKSVFETCVWIGRFTHAFGNGRNYEFIYRKDVKMHLCGQTKAKDANIRQAIMDRYGSEKAIAIGTKKAPGPLYGISKDVWAALGVAITAENKRGRR